MGALFSHTDSASAIQYCQSVWMCVSVQYKVFEQQSHGAESISAVNLPSEERHFHINPLTINPRRSH